MRDTIYRESAIDTLDKHLRMTDVPVSYPGIISALTEWLNESPSAKLEIVRCKDCKYVGTDATCCLVCDREGMGLRPFHVKKDDYCSYAERRTNGVDC